MRFRRLALSLIVMCFFIGCTAAFAEQIPRNIVYYDAKYPVKWLTRGAAEEIRDFLTTLGFQEINAAGLKDWMQEAIAGGAKGTLLVMSQDVAPDTVVGSAPGADALFRKYLDAGGTVIWIADVPFYYIGFEGDKTEKWDYLGGRGVLGFDTVGNWQGRSETRIVETGAEWGLKKKWISIRAVKPSDITKTLAVDADGNVSAWTKQYAEGSAGFIRLWDYGMKNFTDDMGQDLYKVIANISGDFAGERRFGGIYLFKPSDYRPLIHREGDGLVREVLVSVFDNTPGKKKYALNISRNGAALDSILLFEDEQAFYKRNLLVPLRYNDEKLTLVSGSGGRQEIVGETQLSEKNFWFELRWDVLPPRNPVDMGTVLVPGDTVLIGTDQSLRLNVSGLFLGDGDPRPARLAMQVFTRDKSLKSDIALDEKYPPGKFSELVIETAPGNLEPGRYRAEFTVTSGGETVFQEEKWIVVQRAPKPVTEFGAYEANLSYLGTVLSYDAEKEQWSKLKWEDLWLRGPDNDIVVAFPNGNRFVFWRGSSNVPFWASRDNVGLTYEWMEAAWGRGGLVDCIEPLQDKKCRYSRPYIVSSTPARVVIHWRYALADFEYTIADEEWGDEDYVFYPDGFGARKAVGHFLPMSWHEAQEFIVLTPAGVNPFDIFPIFPEYAVTLMSPDGNTREDMRFPQPNGKWEKNAPAVIRVRYSKRDPSTPIMAFRKFDHFVSQYDGWKVDGRYISPSYWGVHWPVTRNYPTTRNAPPMWRESAAHASLTGIESFPDRRKTIDRSLEIVEWTWLIGNTDMSDAQLLKQAANWINPVPLKVLSGGSGGDYDPGQRGYVVTGNPGETVSVQLGGAPDSSIPNLVLIIENYGNLKPKVWLNGKKAPETAFKFGVEKSWTKTVGVLWMSADVPANTKIEIQ